MEEQEIITQVLLKLDNWVLDTKITEDDLSDMDYNKSVTSEEIINTYNDIINYIKSYLQTDDFTNIPIIDTASIFWTAGSLWQKYNQNINNNLDETNVNPLGYGDRLVIQAKEMLKPYKSYSFQAF